MDIHLDTCKHLVFHVWSSKKKAKEIYVNVRKITGKQAPRVRVIKDKDGVVLTDQDQVRKRWREHFSDLYNPVTDTDQTVLAEIPVG